MRWLHISPPKLQAIPTCTREQPSAGRRHYWTDLYRKEPFVVSGTMLDCVDEVKRTHRFRADKAA